jgi:hypothetical protein
MVNNPTASLLTA